MKVNRLATLTLAIGLVAVAATVSAQQVTDAAAAEIVSQSQVTGPPATLTFANRTIAVFRGTVLGRSPAERVATAHGLLEEIRKSGPTGPIETRPLGGLTTVYVGGRYVFAILPTDIDPLSGDTMAGVSSRVVSQLQTTFDEIAELGRPRQLLIAALQFVLATLVFIALVWGLIKAYRALSGRLSRAAEQRLANAKVGDLEFLRAARVSVFVNRILAAVSWVLFAFFVYAWLTFSLRRFPYTRPWGESLRAFFFGQMALVGSAIVGAMPGIFMVLLIAVAARLVSRTIQLFFHGVEEGRISIPGVYAETVMPTRKLVSAGVWLFALALAFPYLPGANSEAFRGVSVFVGLMISLGSSGFVNQVMSGLTLTYSRALRMGDFVRVGEVEGTVEHLGNLSTKIKTIRGEDVTIPNAVVASQTVTNYSRYADTTGVYVGAEVTIGYDTPWRQVQALLLLAASRTPGVRRTPAPVVRQVALEDPYIRYAVMFCPEIPAERAKVLNAVHANILDAFNEYGVQITSPNYEADPETRKVVPRENWYAAPAAAPVGAAGAPGS